MTLQSRATQAYVSTSPGRWRTRVPRRCHEKGHGSTPGDTTRLSGTYSVVWSAEIARAAAACTASERATPTRSMLALSATKKMSGVSAAHSA